MIAIDTSDVSSRSVGFALWHYNFDVMSGRAGIYLNDLYLVFNSPQPIVPSEFSYKISRGYQAVNHQTIKAKAFYNFKKAGRLEYTFARQENKRSEFGEDRFYNQAIVDAAGALKVKMNELAFRATLDQIAEDPYTIFLVDMWQ